MTWIQDFGHLQACMSGTFVPQLDPICADARLTAGELYVDDRDLAAFLACMRGPGGPMCPGLRPIPPLTCDLAIHGCILWQ